MSPARIAVASVIALNLFIFIVLPAARLLGLISF
jgi:hypothetical protein